MERTLGSNMSGRLRVKSMIRLGSWSSRRRFTLQNDQISSTKQELCAMRGFSLRPYWCLSGKGP